MDEVDKKQQEQIDAAAVTNRKQDRDLLILRIVAFVIFMWTVISTAIIMQKVTPFNCPHPECVHHLVEK